VSALVNGVGGQDEEQLLARMDYVERLMQRRKVRSFGNFGTILESLNGKRQSFPGERS
jgi:hypothetical protein